MYACHEECCPPRLKVDVVNSLRDLHNAPIDVNFEFGEGGGVGRLGKGKGFDLEAFFC